MQDHSHKLLFLAATGLMCAAALYGAQVGPEIFAAGPPHEGSIVSVSFSPAHQGIVSAAFGTPQAVDN